MTASPTTAEPAPQPVSAWPTFGVVLLGKGRKPPDDGDDGDDDPNKPDVVDNKREGELDDHKKKPTPWGGLSLPCTMGSVEQQLATCVGLGTPCSGGMGLGEPPWAPGAVAPGSPIVAVSKLRQRLATKEGAKEYLQQLIG